MNSYELTLKVCSELCDLKSAGFHCTLEFVTVVFAFGSFLKIDAACIPAGYLNADISEGRRPFADSLKVIEWRLIGHELRQKDRRSFNSFH